MYVKYDFMTNSMRPESEDARNLVAFRFAPAWTTIFCMTSHGNLSVQPQNVPV